MEHTKFDKFTLAFASVLSLVALAGILSFSQDDVAIVGTVVTAIVSIVSFIFLHGSVPDKRKETES